MLLEFFRVNKLKKIWVPCSLALIVFSAMMLWVMLTISGNTYYKGIYIEDVSMEGMTQLQAKELIEAKTGQLLDQGKFVLENNGQSWTVTYRDISVTYFTDEALKKAYMIGRSGNVFHRFFVVMGLKSEPVHIKVRIGYDKKHLNRIMTAIKKKIDFKEKDASIFYKNGKIDFTEEVYGKSLNIDKNIKLMENYILRGINNRIELEVNDVIPRITMEDIGEIGQELSFFSTTFNPGDANRSHNIRVACERINGKILLPNDVFSMNKALGPRTIENGYKDAPVIYKNELVPGAGGGVCQVTSTLYDAVLKSKMEVVERTNHSLPLGYVEPGQDATIAEGYIDFKFQNSKDYAVAIFAEVKGKTIKIAVLGKAENEGVVVRLKSEIIQVMEPEKEKYIVDDTLLDGERVVVKAAKNGYRVIVYRETYSKQGELLDREKISEDVYKPVQAQIKVNQNTLDSINMLQ